jgi:hypothetical protein
VHFKVTPDTGVHISEMAAGAFQIPFVVVALVSLVEYFQVMLCDRV